MASNDPRDVVGWLGTSGCQPVVLERVRTGEVPPAPVDWVAIGKAAVEYVYKLHRGDVESIAGWGPRRACDCRFCVVALAVGCEDYGGDGGSPAQDDSADLAHRQTRGGD